MPRRKARKPIAPWRQFTWMRAEVGYDLAMLARRLESLLAGDVIRTDLSQRMPDDISQRFESLRGYRHLPVGRTKNATHLSPTQIVAAIFSIGTVRPGYAALAATILKDLLPVGGADASFRGSATFGKAVECLLEDPSAFESLLEVRLSDREIYTNAHCRGAITYCSIARMTEVSFQRFKRSKLICDHHSAALSAGAGPARNCSKSAASSALAAARCRALTVAKAADFLPNAGEPNREMVILPWSRAALPGPVAVKRIDATIVFDQLEYQRSITSDYGLLACPLTYFPAASRHGCSMSGSYLDGQSSLE
jgi:hypothetical protein